MENIKSLLKHESPFIHITSIQDKINEKEEIINSGVHLAFINGENTKNTKSLFGEFSRVFDFPEYFSYNWDSFDEIINDLDWINKDKYIIIISNAEKLLESKFLYNNNKKIFWEIMTDTIKEWNSGRKYDDFPTPPTPFHILLVVPENKKDKFIMNLKEMTDLELDVMS